MNINYVKEIQKLKKDKNAIILAHYYQIPEIQDIADYVGDSYYLSKIAKDCKENIIVFCGVKFMAESAKILSPDKMVLLPILEAGCPMADMATQEDVIALKAKHPDAAVVCYVNSSAEVKAVSDVCCTSSNAIDIIKNIKEKEIIFLPDKNLGNYIQQQVPDKKIILWDGYCPVHNNITKEEILKYKSKYQGIKVLVHPEADMSVLEYADFIGSTGQLIKYATEDHSKDYLIVTEEGVLHQLKLENPDKNFFTPYGSLVCADMKKTTLKDVYESLLYLKYEINLNADLREKAYNSMINMHTLGR